MDHSGHCELYGNEAADQAARAGAKADAQNDVAIDFNTVKVVIKRKTEDYWKRSIAQPYMEHKRQAAHIAPCGAHRCRRTDLVPATLRIHSSCR